MVITTFIAYFVQIDESSHPILTRCDGRVADAEHRRRQPPQTGFHPVRVGGPVGPLPPVFFFSKKSGGKINPKNFENSGGDLVRPHIKNLASPISDFAPPSTPIQFITNSPTLAGGYSTPRAMDRRIIATIA